MLSGGDAIDAIVAFGTGALGGALAASGAGVVFQALGSAALNMLSNAAGQINDIVNSNSGKISFSVGDMLFDGAIGLVSGIAGGNGASYGNTAGIKAATKQLFKRGFFDPKARSYYVKTACRAGGDHVFDALLSSLDKTVIGSTVITGKNLLKKAGLV